MFSKSQEDDNGKGSGLPQATLHELVWRTAAAVKETLALGDPSRVLEHLVTPLADGPHAHTLHRLMDRVADGLVLPAVHRSIVCSSFLVLLNVPLAKAVKSGWFCPATNPPSAVLASHLLLHQRRTWDWADRLAACCCDRDEAVSIKRRLHALRTQVNGGEAVLFYPEAPRPTLPSALPTQSASGRTGSERSPVPRLAPAI